MATKQLMRVEQCRRQLKSGLHMRSVYHRPPWCTQAHSATITVLSLLLERMRSAVICAGNTWHNVRARLETIKLLEHERAGTRVHRRLS